MYQLREVTHQDLGFYLDCFANTSWRMRYDSLNSNIAVQRYVQQMALTAYPNVKRRLFFKAGRPLAFGHACFKGFDDSATECEISGGVHPDLLGTGTGVVFSCIGLDYLFKHFNLHKVTCKVFTHNPVSYAMVKGLGFVHEGTAREHAYNSIEQKYVDVHFLGLLAREFPNKLVKYVLSGVDYAIQ